MQAIDFWIEYCSTFTFLSVARQELDAAWDAEIGRRLAAYDRGEVSALSGEDVFARARLIAGETASLPACGRSRIPCTKSTITLPHAMAPVFVTRWRPRPAE